MKRVLIVLTFIFSACTSTPNNYVIDNRPLIKDVEPPDWVIKGSGAFSDSKGGKIFYGVGSASGIRNFSLQRVTADDRSRNDIAKVIDYYTKSLLKDYMGSTTSGDFKTTQEEQLSEQALQTLTNASLHGVMVIDHWEHPKRNELFSLARLDLDQVKRSLGSFKEMSNKLKDEIRERAEELHEEMELQIQKKLQKTGIHTPQSLTLSGDMLNRYTTNNGHLQKGEMTWRMACAECHGQDGNKNRKMDNSLNYKTIADHVETEWGYTSTKPFPMSPSEVHYVSSFVENNIIPNLTLP